MKNKEIFVLKLRARNKTECGRAVNPSHVLPDICCYLLTYTYKLTGNTECSCLHVEGDIDYIYIIYFSIVRKKEWQSSWIGYFNNKCFLSA